jgi:Uma2 family endonuclease
MVPDGTANPLTQEDLGDTPDDGRRYESIGGDLIVSPISTPEHQRLLARLVLLFATFVNSQRLGEVLFAPVDALVFDHDRVQPDLIIVARERRSTIGGAFISGAPDLVLEVLSPSTHHLDRVRKAALYATSGVREYWLVDAETRTIEVFVLTGQHFEPVRQGAGVARSLLLPRLEVDFDPLFADAG